MLGGPQPLVIPAIGDPIPLTSMVTPTYRRIPLPHRMHTYTSD